jgi:hypothetical protein
VLQFTQPFRFTRTAPCRTLFALHVDIGALPAVLGGSSLGFRAWKGWFGATFPSSSLRKRPRFLQRHGSAMLSPRRLRLALLVEPAGARGSSLQERRSAGSWSTLALLKRPTGKASHQLNPAPSWLCVARAAGGRCFEPHPRRRLHGRGGLCSLLAALYPARRSRISCSRQGSFVGLSGFRATRSRPASARLPPGWLRTH